MNEENNENNEKIQDKEEKIEELVETEGIEKESNKEESKIKNTNDDIKTELKEQIKKELREELKKDFNSKNEDIENKIEEDKKVENQKQEKEKENKSEKAEKKEYKTEYENAKDLTKQSSIYHLKDIATLNESMIKTKRKYSRTTYLLREILEWIICIIIALVLAFLTKYYIGTFTTVKQQSMYPTLEENNKLWLNRFARTINVDYKRGDLITFEEPDIDNSKVSNSFPKAQFVEIPEGKKFDYYFLEIGKRSLIKRVIGVPGDHIVIEDGKIFVNNQELIEEYLPEETETETQILSDFIVPEDHYFAVGDNRNNSTDSRLFGCIPKEKVEGRIVGRVWPFDQFGEIE